MHAKFQPSSLNGVGGGDRRKDRSQPSLNRSLYKISELPPRFAQEGLSKQAFFAAAKPTSEQGYVTDRQLIFVQTNKCALKKCFGFCHCHF